MQRQNVCKPLSLFLLALCFFIVPPTPSHAEEQIQRVASLDMQLIEAGIFGIASTYDPLTKEPEGLETASGEIYDAETWAAAIQIDLRGAFGGIHYGRNYKPAFALVECGDKRVIVRINDVGPLMPGRVIDLNTRTMRYFDPGLEAGLIRNVTVTPLPGIDWIAGPLDDAKSESILLSARQR